MANKLWLGQSPAYCRSCRCGRWRRRADLTGAGDTAVVTRWVEYAALSMEVLAVVIIVVVILLATVLYLQRIVTARADADTHKDYRHGVARALLLGLEILVAADVIRTVALEPSLDNVLVLGLLVLIRTFLGWLLVVEIEEALALATSGRGEEGRRIEDSGPLGESGQEKFRTENRTR